jgi:large subunit ribosomal protein L13
LVLTILEQGDVLFYRIQKRNRVFSLTRFVFEFISFVYQNTGVNTVKKYTLSAKTSDNPDRWHLVDANNAVLGRLATVIAARLRGKHNPFFTPHVDSGDSVIVINADKIVLTGKKATQKIYYRHSGYIGGLKEISAQKLLEKRPEDVLRFAVKGMLPKNKLGRKLIKKLKIYAGDQHPHESQQAQILEL